jgi:hypothetical protein
MEYINRINKDVEEGEKRREKRVKVREKKGGKRVCEGGAVDY